MDDLEVVVAPVGVAEAEEAAALASRLGAAMRVASDESDARLTDVGATGPDRLVVTVGPDGLSLSLGGGPAVKALGARLRPHGGAASGGLHRAVLGGKASVVDATAGLGGDGFALASAGVSVTMIERSRLLFELLAAELVLARAAGGETALAAARIELLHGDSRDVLRSGALAPAATEVIYLDPMFPSTGKAALPPKGMSLLRRLGLEEVGGAEDLLAAARQAAGRRVVVKRHARDPHLGGSTPSGSIRGRTVRFDVYAPL